MSGVPGVMEERAWNDRIITNELRVTNGPDGGEELEEVETNQQEVPMSSDPVSFETFVSNSLNDNIVVCLDRELINELG